MQVFISHASTERDLQLARALARALERADFSPWLDEERLPPGQPLEADLRSAIDASESGIFLISGSWLERKYCKWELEQFGLRKPTPVLIALLRQPRDEIVRLLGPDLSSLTTLEWLDDLKAPEEQFWRLYCGLKGQPPGPQSEWANRGRPWWQASLSSASKPPARAALRESAMRGPYTAISTTCDRTKHWGMIVTHAALPCHEALALMGPRGFGHRQLLTRIAQGLTDPPRVVKEVSWADRRPATMPDLLELLLHALTDQPPASGSLEGQVADQLRTLLATRNVVLLHPPLRGGFDRPALLEYYTSVLPEIVGTAPLAHHLKTVQPLEWLPASTSQRLTEGLHEVLGTILTTTPDAAMESAARAFVQRLKAAANPQMPVTILPVLDSLPKDELDEFAERLDLTEAQRARLLQQVLTVAKTPDEMFEAIDDYYPEVRGDQP